MRRSSRLLLLAALVLVPGVAYAVNEGWTDLLAKFRQQFVHKGEGASIENRKKAIGLLASSKDARAVTELLEGAKKQDKHVGRLRKEFEAEEKAFNEKDARIMEQIERKRKQAQEQGKEGFSVSDEESEWAGSKQNPNPKRLKEKARLGKLYQSVLDEQDVIDYMLRSCARVVGDTEGKEQEGAVATLAAATKAADADRRLAFIKALGYAKGERATDVLEQFAGDTNQDVAITALQAIGRQNSERSIKILTAKLADPRWQVRAAAIEGMTYIRDPRVMDALLEAAKKEEGVLQRNYFVAMARITRESVPATVEAWESFWKANRAELETKWKSQYPIGDPVVDDPPAMEVETTTGSTSFYGITTNSKHIIFVLDVSGSMGDEKTKDPKTGKFPIDIAQTEIRNAIRSMAAAESGDERGDATFNVVTFSTKTEVYAPGKMVKATKKEKEDAQKWVDEHVKAEGATNIHDALEQAFNIVSATREAKNLKQGADTIYFMTDGMPTDGRFIDPELILREVKRWNTTRKITIHTVGVGPAVAQGFLQRLAAENGGQYISR